ncbi:hypothetical protein [Pseudomonas brassicae]|uniref:hypothetical protein n=1 Tax=Pseudomonas brassicae TaxID=2708063 RepID=UPI003083DED1
MTYQPDADDLHVILRTLKRAHLAAGPADAMVRKDRLLRAARLIRENHDAISADFGNRSIYQSMIADLATPLKMLEHSADHVAQWMTHCCLSKARGRSRPTDTPTNRLPTSMPIRARWRPITLAMTRIDSSSSFVKPPPAAW